MKSITRRAFTAGLAAAAPLGFIPDHSNAAPALADDGVAEAERAAKANAWLEISLPSFRANLKTLRKLLDDATHSKTKICVVMKADAYGHGIALLLPEVLAAKVAAIGFTGNEEARVIHGFSMPGASGERFEGRLIRLRTATIGEVEDAFQYGVEELIGNYELAKQINDSVKKSKLDASFKLKIHICLNAGGMSRNGLEYQSSVGKTDLRRIHAECDRLQIVGIMTHFPVEAVDDVSTHFDEFSKEAKEVLDTDKTIAAELHTANSFTTVMVSKAHLDMVRVGGALYGDTVTSKDYTFERVMTFKSKVASVNAYNKGDTVSYGRTKTLTRDTLLANIPVGYSDGYRRDFSNLSYVLIRGQRVPCMGRVTMNTFMVDVTDLGDVKIGEEVVLFGRQGGEEITQDELENDSDTSGAEFTTVWGELNPRKAT